MKPIGEASTDYRDYGDFIAGEVSPKFSKFINDNYIAENEDIIEDDYFAVEYAKYFIEKRKHENELKQKYQEERMKKDQTLWMKALSLIGL